MPQSAARQSRENIRRLLPKVFSYLWVVAALAFLAISACTEGSEPNSPPPLPTSVVQGVNPTAIRLREPEKQVETTLIQGCKFKKTTTHSTYSLPMETVIDITEIEKVSCATNSKMGTVTITAFNKATGGSVGSIRWKQVLFGPSASIGDPRWGASAVDSSRFVVVSTDAEADFNHVYQYVSVKTGERVVMSEPPALFVNLNLGKEYRIIGIRGGFNMLSLSENDNMEPTVSLREKQKYCNDLQAIVEYGTDEHQLDRVFLIRTERDLAWKVSIVDPQPRWLFRGVPVDSKALPNLIKGSIADVRELVAEFQMIDMLKGEDSPLQIPIVGDRLDIKHAVVPPLFKLTKECDK